MNPTDNSLSRRQFISKTAGGLGAGLILGAPNILRAANKDGSDKIHVGLIGQGKQGRVLFEAMSNIPGLHFQAVCDIWKYNRDSGVGRIRNLQGHTPKGYEDIDDMLANEKGLDAVVIATPDFWHSPHTVKCLEAGLNVYCEKMMSNTIDGARAMVKAMEKSGKLCQIGHQRRSNPRYRFTLNKLINGQNICGQITNVNGQWNRSLSASQDIAYKPSLALNQATLEKYGFKSMHQFMNWRTYRDLSGGPISDLGAHQIDIFNWFLGGPPKRVYATGGNAYFKEREQFDNVMCLFDYDTPHGEVRAFYEVLTTTSYGGGFFESFLGTKASIKISEISSASAIYRENSSKKEDDAGGAKVEDTAKLWDDLVKRGYLARKAAPPPPPPSAGAVKSYESKPPEIFELPGDLPYITLKDGSAIPKPAHQPHLENFFAAVRGQAKLNCDARHAFESEAPIFWVNPSARERRMIELTSEHLSV